MSKYWLKPFDISASMSSSSEYFWDFLDFEKFDWSFGVLGSYSSYYYIWWKQMVVTDEC